jgi:hypothetical protein
MSKKTEFGAEGLAVGLQHGPIRTMAQFPIEVLQRLSNLLGRLHVHIVVL